MGLSKVGIIPEFVISANGADVTKKINERLISLRYSDSAGLKSDTFEFTVSDAIDDATIEMPKVGAKLALYLGYDGKTQRMGEFVVDEVEREGWPDTLTVRAHAAVFNEGKNGEKALQSQKNRRWKKAKFKDIAEKIAKDNKLTATVSSSLTSIEVPSTHQTDESDLHFLIRIARRYDGVVKVAGGKLMVVKKAEGKTMSGSTLSFDIASEDVTSYRMTMAKREESGTVRAYWHEIKKGKRHAVTVGEGEPETSLKMHYTDETSAKEAARAELARRGRQSAKLSLELPGRPELVAESTISLSGFRSGVNGSWTVTTVEHTLNSAGYMCSIEAEVKSAEAGSPPSTSKTSKATEGEDDPEDAVDKAHD